MKVLRISTHCQEKNSDLLQVQGVGPSKSTAVTNDDHHKSPLVQSTMGQTQC